MSLKYIENNVSLANIVRKNNFTMGNIDTSNAYLDYESFNLKFKENLNNTKKVSCYHVNIRSLNKNHGELVELLNTISLKFDIIALTEIWATNFDCYKNLLDGYTCYFKLPEIGRVGGVAVYIKNSFNCIQLDISVSKVFCDCEDVCVRVSLNNFIVNILCIYRHPKKDNFNIFCENLNNAIKELEEANNFYCILGDINVDLIKYTEKDTLNYLDIFLNRQMYPAVIYPTRVVKNNFSLIDHIFIGNISKLKKFKSFSGNILSDFSDHFSQYLIIDTIIKNYDERPYIRRHNDNNIRKFISEVEKLEIKNLNSSELNDNVAIDSSYNETLTNLNTLYDQCFPLVKISRKEFCDKPWINNEIKEGIQNKNKLYKKYRRKPNDKNIIRYKNTNRISNRNVYFAKKTTIKICALIMA